VRGVRWAAHRGASGGVAVGHRGGAVAVRKTRWWGVPARERRREGHGEVWSAPGVLGVAFIGPGEGAGGVAGVTAVMSGY
jgi:hypothetical protein